MAAAPRWYQYQRTLILSASTVMNIRWLSRMFVHVDGNRWKQKTKKKSLKKCLTLLFVGENASTIDEKVKNWQQQRDICRVSDRICCVVQKNLPRCTTIHQSWTVSEVVTADRVQSVMDLVCAVKSKLLFALAQDLMRKSELSFLHLADCSLFVHLPETCWVGSLGPVKREDLCGQAGPFAGKEVFREKREALVSWGNGDKDFLHKAVKLLNLALNPLSLS